MNALIALAVWCQSHGPETILTTQHRRPLSLSASPPSSLSPPYNGNAASKDSSLSNIHNTATTNNNNNNSNNNNDNNSNSNNNNNHSNSNDTPGPLLPEPHSTSTSTSSSSSDIALTAAATPSTPSTHTLEPKRSKRSFHQPSPSGSSPVGSRPTSAHPGFSLSSSSGTHSSSTGGNTCECQFSVPTGERSIHSIDPLNSEVSYISQPVPVDASLFAPLRMACIRALNSETYCGREGPILFGDGVNGYVLSYIFTVHDAQSRGQHVRYTIMTMMTDRVYLVASMEYLISQFQVIAFNLQSTANAICPQQQSPATRSMSYSSSHHRRSIMPESAPTKRGRPLTDVLAKPDIFVQLHAAFVSVLSNCSRRLTERHVQGRPIFDYATQESKHEKQQQQTQPQTLTLTQGGGAGAQGARIDSLRELRRVLGRRQFDKLVWNTLVGNQVIVRGGETRIVHDIIRVLEEVLPKDCCTVILDGSSYEPSYACNILGLDRHIPIPPDLYPEDFILLDIWLDYSGRHQIPTPPPSLPALDASQRSGSGAMTTPPPIYQADWSSATLVADMKDLATRLEKTVIASSESNTNGNNHGHGQAGDATAAVVGRSPPISSPGALYPSSTGVEPRPERMYLLQAGEEPPVEFKMNFEGEIGLQDSIGRRAGAGAGVGPGAILQMSYQQDCRLFIETVNEILDYKLPRKIETKRLELMLEEWISKSIQFHNLYKAGKASDEAVVDRFLQSMRVDRQDLKILRFFTRCAKSSAFQAQKYRSEDAGVLSTGATSQPSSIPSVAAAMMTTTTTTATTLTVTAATTTASIAATTAMATTASST